MKRRVSVLIFAAALAGCASIPVEQEAAACRSTDWTAFGQNDGALGVAQSEREARFLRCSELGAPVDLASYQAGRAKGLQDYCTVENGLRVGLEGRSYRGVCPPELETAFLQGLEEGRIARPVRSSGAIFVTKGFGFRRGFGFRGRFAFGKRFGFRRGFSRRFSGHGRGSFHRGRRLRH